MKYCSKVDTNSRMSVGDDLTAVSHSIYERGSFWDSIFESEESL